MALVPALATGGALEATLAHMDQVSAKFSGLSADLDKLSHTAVINQDDVEKGTVLMKRPKPHDVRALYDIKQPDPQKLALDGHKGQIYKPKIQTVEEYDLSRYKGLVDQFLLLGFGTSSKDLAAAYSITYGGAESVSGEKTTRIVLIPKTEEMLAHLKKVELWISDSMGVPVQQKLYWPGDDFYLATYSNMKINPNIPDSAIQLNLPKGVKRVFPGK
jgi:outer membrane lipoprotein-sorting protein